MGAGSLLNLVLRFVFSWVDAIISKLITTIYGLFSDLSQLVLYNENMVKVLGQRVGLILGVFMLFKLAISLISYLISPDKLSDSSKGGGKLIINVAISLALLITINPIFKTAYKVQGIIVQSRIIERIFFGKSGVLQNKNSTTGNAVKMDIGYYLYTGFIPPNSDIFGDTCDRIWDASYDITLKDDPNSKSCDELLYQIMDDDARKSIYKARNTLDMSYIFKDYSLIMEYPQSMVPAFDYTPIISHVSGIVVLLILISFSMELAKRAIKLLFLQIIAPIPIISNMDINKGQDIFKKWGKECINTYLSIFIRLIAINFAVFMIVLLRGNYKSVFVNNVWLNIALIVGCLMFAKDVPKLLEELLGIKMDGMSLHPLKKFQEQALFGKQITSFAGGAARGVTAGTLGIASGAIGAGMAAKQLGYEGKKFAGSLFTGAFHGLTGGFSGGVRAKSFREGLGKGAGQLKLSGERTNLYDGTTLGGRIKSGFQQRVGLKTESDKIKSKVDKLNNFYNAADSAFKRANSEMVKHDDLEANGITMLQQKQLKEKLEIMRSGAPAMRDYGDNVEAYEQAVEEHSQKVAELQQQILDNDKAFEQAYINNYGESDAELAGYLNQAKEYETELKKYGPNDKDLEGLSIDTSDAKSLKDSRQNALVQKQKIESSFNDEGINRYQQEQANAAASKPHGN